MKKLWGTVFLLLITFLAFSQKVRPALNLSKGDTYTLIFEQTTTTSQTIRERPLETRLILSAKIRFTITDVKDTLYYIKTKYDSVAMQMDMPNGNLQFSSEHADTAKLYSKILVQFKALPFQIVITRSGKIISANEADKNLAGITDALHLSAEQREQAFKQLQASVGSNAFITMLEKLTLIYPSPDVNKTTKWVLENRAQGEPPLTLRNFYFIKNSTPTHFIIQGNGTAESIITIDSAQLNGMPVKRNLAGNTTSAITISKKTGWPATAEVTQQLKGNVIIADNAKLPGGLVIPITINTNLIVITP